MSARPHPPGRKLWKYIRCPSGENAGATSLELELTVGPRFCGGPQGSSTLARCETQMSSPPKPPRRPDVMYRLRPSLEIAGRLSSSGELTSGPRLIGIDQGPHSGPSAMTSATTLREALGPTGSISTRHPWKTVPKNNKAKNLVRGVIVASSCVFVEAMRLAASPLRPPGRG